MAYRAKLVTRASGAGLKKITSACSVSTILLLAMLITFGEHKVFLMGGDTPSPLTGDRNASPDAKTSIKPTASPATSLSTPPCRDGSLIQIDRNTSTFSGKQLVYGLGVEGVGHHGVFPLLTGLAQITGRRVHLKQIANTRAMEVEGHNFRGIVAKVLLSVGATVARGNDIFIEDNSFPSGFNDLYIHAQNASTIKLWRRYNLEANAETWRLMNMQVKLVLYKRDFKQLVWTHKNFEEIRNRAHEGGLAFWEGHAVRMASYMEHLSSELDCISSRRLGDWRLLEYEQLLKYESFKGVTHGLINFLGYMMPKEGLEAFAMRMHSQYLKGLEKSHKSQGGKHAPMNWTTNQTRVLDELIASRKETAWANYYREDKLLFNNCSGLH